MFVADNNVSNEQKASSNVPCMQHIRIISEYKYTSVAYKSIFNDRVSTVYQIKA